MKAGAVRLTVIVMFGAWTLVVMSGRWTGHARPFVLLGLLAAAVSVATLWAPWCQRLLRGPRGSGPVPAGRDTLVAIGIVAIASTMMCGLMLLIG